MVLQGLVQDRFAWVFTGYSHGLHLMGADFAELAEMAENLLDIKVLLFIKEFKI